MIQGALLLAGLIIAPISDGNSGDAPGYWDWQLTQPYNLDIDVQVLALDGDEHDASVIAALNARGIKTVCYISVGTWEDFRADADRFPASALGNPLPYWEGERYLDIRDLQTVLPIMLDRIENCKARGYDAIEPDNIDAFENDNGFDLTEEDTLKYLGLIADYAHSLGLEVAQKNAVTLVPLLVDQFDFMFVEDCFQYDFCSEVLPYLARGKDVLAVEYTDSALDWDSICAQARDLGFHLLMKDREVSAGGLACVWN